MDAASGWQVVRLTPTAPVPFRLSCQICSTAHRYDPAVQHLQLPLTKNTNMKVCADT